MGECMTRGIESDTHFAYESQGCPSLFLIGQALKKLLDLGKPILLIVTQVSELVPRAGVPHDTQGEGSRSVWLGGTASSLFRYLEMAVLSVVKKEKTPNLRPELNELCRPNYHTYALLDNE